MNLENIGFYTLSNDRIKNTSSTSNLSRGEIVLSDKCNFKCLYCRGLRKDCSGDMPFKNAKNIIHLWANDNLQNIRFSGGEPTLYPGLRTLVSMSKSLGIKRIAVSTNGSADLNIYKTLIEAGVNDFSISLDACCSSVCDKMSGVNGYYNTIINNIKHLSKLTYVTVGMVFTQYNIRQAEEVIEFAHSLGVADIRIIPSAQSNDTMKVNVSESIQNVHPILKYRIHNNKTGRKIRGLSDFDYHKCALVLDDSAVAGDYHFPCIIYLREQGNPIVR